MRSLNPKWTAFTLSYYAANAVWQGYMSLYYRSIGFSGGQIGFISALMALCALVVQPLWGIWGDRCVHTRRLLALLALLGAAVLPAMLLGNGFLWQILCAVVFYAFYCALLPMGDSILLARLGRDNLPFGPYRLCGAAAFALSGAVFGWILDRTGVSSIILTGTVLLLFAAASALLLPDSRRKKRGKLAFRSLFRNKKLMGLLAFMIPVQMTMGYFHTFFSTHFSALPGANSALLGLAYAVATLGEK